MPMMPKRPCAQSGCPAVAVQGSSRCQVHAAQQPRVVYARRDTPRYYDAHRGTPAERGYDAGWAIIRRAFLAAYPVCEWAGCMKAATDVHHVVALRDGGSHAEDNLMALCHAHHSSLTASTQPWGRRRVGRGEAKV